MIPPLSPREWAGWWAGLALGVAGYWLRRLAPWLLAAALVACCWWLAGCESWRWPVTPVERLEALGACGLAQEWVAEAGLTDHASALEVTP